MPVPFRILSVDGGGVRGYLAACILENVEALLDRETGSQEAIGTRFDFIVGTSIGGIIAVALANGMRASDVRQKLEVLIPRVFGRSAVNAGAVGQWWRTKYRPRFLRDELTKLFQGDTLATLRTDVCITSVAIADASPRLHKTDYLARNQARQDEALVDVCLCTSAAPTYFPAHSCKHSTNVVDGGLVANNPAMIGLVDALRFERASRRGTLRPGLEPESAATPVVLSVGTGEPGVVPYNYESLVNGGRATWARPVYEVLMLSQANLVHHQLATVMGGRYLRVNPKLPKAIELDDVESFLDLRSLADVTAGTEAFYKAWLV
jgi:patatin-like phospholipase/acyl hydrolase